MSKKKRNVRRIAVLGNNNAGKTVFITSLIANFEHYDPEILKLGDGWRVISAKMTNDEAVNGLNRFPKEFYYRTLVDNGKWPKKTYSASVACLD
ncbi:MAG: YcjX family protein, partial [Kiritimatiellae bacterium]|nr:YcjX family protein [Kiritimatiellia bacterium]